MTTNELIETLDGLDDDGIRTIAEKAKTLQRHIDRRVNGAIAKAKETPAEPDPATVLDAKEKALDRKESILSSAIERGIDPKAAFALLGINPDSTDDDRLDAIAAYGESTEQATKDKILKEHARNPRTGSLDMTPMTLEQISDLPPHVQKQLPPSVTEPALQSHIDKRKSLPSPRSDIRSRLFGGQK